MDCMLYKCVSGVNELIPYWLLREKKEEWRMIQCLGLSAIPRFKPEIDPCHVEGFNQGQFVNSRISAFDGDF